MTIRFSQLKKTSLTEARNERVDVVITFGRFNPPTSGHQLLVESVKKIAKNLGAEHIIYATHSQDKNKNPLKWKDKVVFMKKAFSGANISEDAKIRTLFEALGDLVDSGKKRIVMVVGGDRVSEFDKLVRKYVDQMGIEYFKVMSAGKRDPDADDVTGMSASKLRAAAAEGDFDSFKSGMASGLNDRDILRLYKKVRDGMGIKESKVNESFETFLTEEEKKTPTVIVLTSDTDSDTVDRMAKIASKKGSNLYAVDVDKAFIVDEDVNDNDLTLHNYDGNNKKLTVVLDNTIVMVRGGVLNSQSGIAIWKTLEESGAFVINKQDPMEFCQNKFSTSLGLELNGLPTPRTAMVNNEDAIDKALEKVGGKFPVIIKTITGAEGIGVSKVESHESLKSVLQSLWKFGASLILQEYMEIEYDIRSLVLDGKVIASVKRLKSNDKDFRTNKALGNDTEPYELSKEEQKLVRKAAKISGCYYAGVDHITVDGKHYLLEVNGSPGSGAEPYFGYDKGGPISSDELISNVLDYILDKENWQYAMKQVGYVEYIDIDGTGAIKARVDTGNSGFNVAHVEDVDIKDGKITCKLNGKKITKKILGRKNVKVGDEEEDRVHVLFDVVFGGKEYKDVEFTLDDRSNRVYPVLIGRQFLTQYHYSVDPSQKFVMVESLQEKAPPDPSMERFIRKNKQEFIDRYGAEQGMEILYATAWKMYNKKNEDIEFEFQEV